MRRNSRNNLHPYSSGRTYPKVFQTCFLIQDTTWPVNALGQFADILVSLADVSPGWGRNILGAIGLGMCTVHYLGTGQYILVQFQRVTLNCHSITRHLSVYIEYNLFSLLSFKCSVVFNVLFLKGQGYNTTHTHTYAQSILGTQSVISLRGQFLARALAIFIRLDSIVTEYTSEDIKPTGFFVSF